MPLSLSSKNNRMHRHFTVMYVYMMWIPFVSIKCRMCLQQGHSCLRLHIIMMMPGCGNWVFLYGCARKVSFIVSHRWPSCCLSSRRIYARHNGAHDTHIHAKHTKTEGVPSPGTFGGRQINSSRWTMTTKTCRVKIIEYERKLSSHLSTLKFPCRCCCWAMCVCVWAYRCSDNRSECSESYSFSRVRLARMRERDEKSRWSGRSIKF